MYFQIVFFFIWSVVCVYSCEFRIRNSTFKSMRLAFESAVLFFLLLFSVSQQITDEGVRRRRETDIRVYHIPISCYIIIQ